jgi:hypothetical protein
VTPKRHAARYLDLARQAQAKLGRPVTSHDLARELLLTRRMVRHYLRAWEADGSIEPLPRGHHHARQRWRVRP